MKTKQKYLALVAVGACILFLCFAFRTQDNNSNTILIRSTQIAFGGRDKSFIRVYKGNTQIEKIQIDKWNWEDEELNFDKILTTVQNYEKQGYQVISHSELMFGSNGFVNTFVLSRK